MTVHTFNLSHALKFIKFTELLEKNKKNKKKLLTTGNAYIIMLTQGYQRKKKEQ